MLSSQAPALATFHTPVRSEKNARAEQELCRTQIDIPRRGLLPAYHPKFVLQ
jgi:hypothetical protein